MTSPLHMPPSIFKIAFYFSFETELDGFNVNWANLSVEIEKLAQLSPFISPICGDKEKGIR